MVKVYKFKDKLAIYLPFDVVKELNLKEGDETDFFRFKNNAYIFANKSYIAELLTGKPMQEAKEAPISRQAQKEEVELNQQEIAVLKKLDSLRYGNRTKANVVKLFDSSEKTILKELMKKKAVTLFAKDKSKEPLFGISSGVYDRYLMRKKQQATASSQQQTPIAKVSEVKINYQRQPAQNRDGIENENIKILEKDGFIVLQYEAEASALSLALEQSIRKGMVLGTRSFNKKFYIILRSYFDRYGSKILKALKDGELKVAQISKEVEIDEDGARAILYLLAESGDVSEKKRDLFTLA